MLGYSVAVLLAVGIIGLRGKSGTHKIMGVIGLAGVVLLIAFGLLWPVKPTIAEQQEVYREFMIQINECAALVESTATNYPNLVAELSDDTGDSNAVHGSFAMLEGLARGSWSKMNNITLSGKLSSANLARLDSILQDYRSYAYVHVEVYQAMQHYIELGQFDQAEELSEKLTDAALYLDSAAQQAEELELILQLR